MEKRYQVFISSTFLDLKEERQAVSQALLQSDCFPAQMENWPAMDAEQMEAIKEIIDQSDYYLVISAGKYGSLDEVTGLSFTELEYDYAMKIGKPIIRLLRVDPFNALPGSRIEKKATLRKKLEAFHGKLKAGKVCKFWENPDQLQKETILGLLDIKRRHPATGWVEADKIASHDAELKIEKLEKTIAELRLEISEVNATNLNVTEIISPYRDDFAVKLGRLQDDGSGGLEPSGNHSQVSVCTENEICRLILIAALSEISEHSIFNSVMGHLGHGDLDSHESYYADETFENFQRLMFTLESKGLFDSRVLADGTSARIEWHLSRPARRWASQIRAENL